MGRPHGSLTDLNFAKAGGYSPLRITLDRWAVRLKVKDPPTIVHCTHWKAGSQWIRKILQAVCESTGWDAGSVWAVDRRDRLLRCLDVWHTPAVHPADFEALNRETAFPPEKGMIYLIDNWLPHCAQMQWTWYNAGEPLIHYEDLLDDDSLMEDILYRRCAIGCGLPRLRTAISTNKFERFTGRARGTEDLRAHERKGISGDWKNHFTDPIRDAFKDRYGDLQIAMGYEFDYDW